ncbi:MAG: P-II family nitrogen regulator [Gammaproteobacteria bacterium]|nr:P-II family nitrogen regulator [Gammaproteobacteria bacterium]MBU0786592.1 P-II family nitrogen regulator [Gammaproteobacteria bacterium]MBU0814337.1 P-II family nitrogen regulator [Gammaproteobacteria bacterium]MBU1786143.1 P-II family nitrogen regulator [Gammaproteobacteria bacterium]
MKEVKAYVHSNRIADVISALKSSAAWTAAGSGEHNLTVYMVKGSLAPLDESEHRYSVDLGDEVINEYKLEFHCADDHVDDMVKIIVATGRTGKNNSGWVYIVDIVSAVPIS